MLDRLASTVGGVIFALAALSIGAAVGAFAFLGRWQWNLPGGWVWAAVVVGLGAGGGLLLWAWLKPDSFLGRAFRSLRKSAAHLLSCPRRSTHALICAVLTAVLFNVTQVCCLQAVSPEPVPWQKLLWLYHVVTFVAALPITIAGTGLREGASMLLLSQYGVDAPTAVAGAMLTLSVHLSWALFGAGLLVREQRLRRSHPRRPLPRTISVVVPTWNEAATLPETLRRLRAVPQVGEIIVADGGSTDDTIACANQMGCRVVETSRGRGLQMRAGAASATGEVVLFSMPTPGCHPTRGPPCYGVCGIRSWWVAVFGRDSATRPGS
jgi:hypothetical protein